MTIFCHHIRSPIKAICLYDLIFQHIIYLIYTKGKLLLRCMQDVLGLSFSKISSLFFIIYYFLIKFPNCDFNG